MKGFYRGCLGLIAVWVPLSLFADQDVISEGDVLAEIVMVRIASRLDQPVNMAPASVTIIDRELIDASGAQSWADVFRLVPGFQSYSINDNRPGISYHGFGEEFSTQLEVMLDGRSVYSPVFSSVPWGVLGVALEDVDHIEVVRGPSAATHGSNAFLGAVNIVTRTPLQDSGLGMKVTSGSRSTRKAWARLNARAGVMNYRISAAYRHNDGFPSVPGQGDLDDGSELYQATFRGTITPTFNDLLDINFGYAQDRVGLGDADHPDEFLDTDDHSSYQSLEWQHTMASGGEFSVHGYHNRFRVESLATGLLSQALGIAPEAVPVALGIPDQLANGGLGRLAAERFDVEFEHQFSVAEHFRMVWGLGARNEYAENALLHGRDDKIREESYRGFTHGEWQPHEAWLVNAGAMVEDTFVGALFSPRISISYLFAPGQNIRLSVSQGKRAPSITGANLDHVAGTENLVINAVIRSDDDLKEEKVTSFELAWAGHFPNWHLTADINVYREEVRDAIDTYTEPFPSTELLAQNPSLRSLDDLINVQSNTDEWEATGIEMQLVYRPTTRSLARLHYTYSDVDSTTVVAFEPVPVLGNFNDARPRHVGGLVLNYSWVPELDTGITLYHQSEANWRGGNFIDEYTRVDAQLTYRFKLGRSNGKVQLIAQNLTDDYSEFNKNNKFEARYFLSLNVDLP